ncbi:MAG: DNA polymerase III subunit beta [Alphaproteobacteria bacterium]|nr:DNA polymerase III subunit beta [Alphaproteobacteria bacterium]
MKFTIERAALLKSLSHIQNVVERRHTNPLLSNVKITATDGEIVLNATDNELEVSEKTPAKVDAAGSITAPAHKLYEIVRKLPDGAEIEFVLNAENNQLKMTAGRAKFALATMAGEDFPTIADGDMTHHFVLKASDLRDLIDRTSFAVSTEETRFYLNGIYLHEAISKEEKILRAVATDGHRLACAETVFPEGAAGMPGIIIPRKAIGELSKLLAEEQGDVRIDLSVYKIRFAFGDLVLTSLLIEGTYPDYERVIPTENDKIMEVDAQALTAVVDRVSSLSEKSRAVRLTLAPDLVRVSAANAEEGSAEDELEVKYAADPMDVGFNYVYLEDVLKQIKGGLVQIAFSDSASPTVLTDMSDPSVLFVLMPMRV